MSTTDHLTPERWAQANRLLIRKAIAEFTHERLLTPVETETGRYVVTSDDGLTEYAFAAELLQLNHWVVDADSIIRTRAGETLALDMLDFVIELRETLGLSATVLPTYLEEITSTLASTAYKLAGPRVSAAELAGADFQAIERGMTEGHPCFVANNGRIGFSIDEYRAYAPEAGAPVRLIWLAARRELATFSSCTDLDYETLLAEELGPETLARFRSTLAERGLDLADFLLIPVHPWQWTNRLAVTFAGELAKRNLVLLGESADEYQAQQSIRTFFNTSAPHRRYVKTAMSVLNMGFLRGLSSEYMRDTPAINDWVATLFAGDEVLRRTGVSMLREQASIGYHHEQYLAACAKGSPYLKMLAALWRESPIPQLQPGERLATMASLLHVDQDGASFAGALITRSGLPANEWLRQYLDAYLVPLLQCYYGHDLVFMPHGENVILVLDEAGAVRRVILKDIGEEVALMDTAVELPPGVDRIQTDVPQELRVLSIFTDVVDCFFRFLSATLHTEGLLNQEEFFATVAACIRDYQDSVPELADRFAADDLFADEFALSCLNRLQLRNNQHMLDLQDPAGALQLAGNLTNPIARFAPARAY
ncbi:IucA/IucC family protein [Kribbella sp. NPDC020789]